MKNLLIALHDFNYEKYKNQNWEIIDTTKIEEKLTRQILSKTLRNRYDNLVIGCDNWHIQMKKFFIKATIIICPSKNKQIIDNQGETHHISIFNFLVSGFTFILDHLISYPLYFWLKLKIFILEKRKLITIVPPKQITNIAYLKPDFIFKILAGGSVGHTAGVINAFHNLGIKTNFYAMKEIPTINPKIKTTIIPHNLFFNNINEMQPNIYNIFFNKGVKISLKKQLPDIIYQRYSIKNFSGVTLSRKYKLPLILEYNGSEVWASKNWGIPFIHQKFAEKVELANLKHAHLIVVVSQPIKEQLIKLGVEPEKIFVHPNCIDPKKFHPKVDGSQIRKKYNLENKTIVSFIGTFGKWHGVEEIAKAIKPCIQENPNLHFLLIGDGLMREQVEEIIKKDQVQNHTTLTGLIPQAQGPSYLAAGDILLSPTLPNPDGTKFFGSPTKIFEYMGLGKAIVASNLEQIGKVLEDQKTALLIEPGNTEDLIKKINILAKDKSLRDKLGQAAHQEVLKKYTWNKNVTAVLNKFKELYPN